MLWTVIDESDIFRSPVCVNESIRSTNPFDYIQGGYTLDNAALFGGRNNVSFNSDISGFSAGAELDISYIGKRTFRYIP
jgi:hypothetical protein